MDREYLKETSKQQIKGKIGKLFLMGIVVSAVVIAVLIVLSLISAMVSMIISSATKTDVSDIITTSTPIITGIYYIILFIIFVPAFSLSMANVYLAIANNNYIDVSDIFSGFKNFWAAFKVLFLVGLFTYLWSLLLIVPGIIKGISYSMSMYILSEDESKPALQCIRESKEMTNGHKMDLFVLGLSFIGWILLGTITCGILFIYVGPYINTTFANAYKSLKKNAVIDSQQFDATQAIEQ